MSSTTSSNHLSFLGFTLEDSGHATRQAYCGLLVAAKGISGKDTVYFPLVRLDPPFGHLNPQGNSELDLWLPGFFLQPEKAAEVLAAWLKEHPEVEG